MNFGSNPLVHDKERVDWIRLIRVVGHMNRQYVCACALCTFLPYLRRADDPTKTIKETQKKASRGNKSVNISAVVVISPSLLFISFFFSNDSLEHMEYAYAPYVCIVRSHWFAMLRQSDCVHNSSFFVVRISLSQQFHLIFRSFRLILTWLGSASFNLCGFSAFESRALAG